MDSRKWTQEDDAFLIENYPIKGVKWCAEKLDRTERAIQLRAQKRGLRLSKEAKSKFSIKYTKEILEEAVKASKSYADVIRAVGLVAQAGNFATIKNRITEYKIDISHFLSQSELSKIRLKANKNNFNLKPLEEILVANSNYNATALKKRLYDAGLKNKECELCGQGELWYGKPLGLRLDHINGDHSDNRFENLRIVCPNCDSTLPTYCSKNRKTKSKEISTDDVITNTSEIARRNSQKKTTEANDRPSAEQVLRDLKRMTYTDAGKKYGVTCNTLRKWIKKEGITPPSKMKRAKKIHDKDQISMRLD